MNGRPSYMSICRRSPVVVVGLLLLLSMTGCSFVFSEGAPLQHERMVYFDCSRAYAPPISDVLISLSQAANAALIQENKEITERERDTITATNITIAALTAASAVYGFVVVTRCKEAQELRLARNARQQLLPPPYGVPPHGQAPAIWPPPRFEITTPAAPAPAPAAPPAPAAAPAPAAPPVPAQP